MKTSLFLLFISGIFSITANNYTPWTHFGIILNEQADLSNYPHTNNPGTDYLTPTIFIEALNQKVAPIITTSNVIHSFLLRRSQWAKGLAYNNSLEQKMTQYANQWYSVIKQAKENKLSLAQTDEIINQEFTKLKTIISQEFPPTNFADYQFNYSLFNAPFNEAEWDIYQSTLGNWFVFVPKQYIVIKTQEWKNLNIENTLTSYKEALKISLHTSLAAEEQNFIKGEITKAENQLQKIKDPNAFQAYLIGLHTDKPVILKKVSISDLQPQITLPSAMIKNEINFADLFPIFINRKEHALGGWIFWLEGHGLAIASIKTELIKTYETALERLSSISKTLHELKETTENASQQDVDQFNQYFQSFHSEFRINTKMTAPEVASIIEKFTQEIQNKLNDAINKEIPHIEAEKILEENVYIANMKLSQFRNFITFLNNNIFTKLLCYQTCYGGGAHLSFPFKEKLIEKIENKIKTKVQEIPIDYIIISMATTDESVRLYLTTMKPETNEINIKKFDWPYYAIQNNPLEYFKIIYNFTSFFYYSHLFFTQPSKDINLSTIITNSYFALKYFEQAATITSIASVRFPGINFFQATNLNNWFEIITFAKAQAKKIEKKPFVIDKIAVLLYPTEIETPLKIIKNKIVLDIIHSYYGKYEQIPTFISMAQGPGIHYLHEIDASEFSIDTVVPSFAQLRHTMPKLFAIKTLKTREGTFSSVLIYLHEAKQEFVGNLNGQYYSAISIGINEPDKINTEKGIDLTKLLLNTWLTQAKKAITAPTDAPWLSDEAVLINRIEKEFIKETPPSFVTNLDKLGNALNALASTFKAV